MPIQPKPQITKPIANMAIKVAALGIGTEQLQELFRWNVEIQIDLTGLAKFRKQKPLVRRIRDCGQYARVNRYPLQQTKASSTYIVPTLILREPVKGSIRRLTESSRNIRFLKSELEAFRAQFKQDLVDGKTSKT